MKSLFTLFLFVFGAEAATVSSDPTLVVYSYDSLTASYAWGPIVVQSFEKKMKAQGTPVRVQLVSVGEGSQILNRLKLDQQRKKPLAHIAWGLDPASFRKIEKEVEPHPLPSGFPWKKEVQAVSSPGFIPYDFGIYALIQNTEKLPLDQAPKDWKDLLLPQFKKKLLFEDPRTSIPGLAWLLGSQKVLGEKEAPAFWKKLKDQWLTLAPSWTQAYALFYKDQAPLVWSYLTSQAYHQDQVSVRPAPPLVYRAVLFQSGQPLQVEGISIIPGAKDFSVMKSFAHQFVDHVISLEAQSQLPQTQWMFPVRTDVKLPESFLALPVPNVLLPVFDDQSPETVKALVKNWSASLR